MRQAPYRAILLAHHYLDSTTAVADEIECFSRTMSFIAARVRYLAHSSERASHPSGSK
jgi:hypothetical protein